MGGQRAWLALYMCRPRAEGGNIIKRAWWRMYEGSGPDAFGTEIISVDAAFKDGEQNDYAAITVWGKRDEDYSLLDCRNEHLDFVETLNALRQTRARFPKARSVLVEDKANGSAILSVLQKEMFCIPVEPKGDKKSRVYSVSAAIESGHVFLPENAPWVEEYINQWTVFPAGEHDDMVDSSTQALLHLFFCNGAWQPPSKQEQLRMEDERYAREALIGAGAYNVYGGGW